MPQKERKRCTTIAPGAKTGYDEYPSDNEDNEQQQAKAAQVAPSERVRSQ